MQTVDPHAIETAEQLRAIIGEPMPTVAGARARRRTEP